MLSNLLQFCKNKLFKNKTPLQHLNAKLKLQCSLWFFTLIYLLFVMIFSNTNFWGTLYILNSQSFTVFARLCMFLIFLLGFCYAFCLVGVKLILLAFCKAKFNKYFKIFLCIITIANAFASYFISAYNIYMDESMIDNILHTDTKEASNLFSMQMVIYILTFGILPCFVILKTQITPPQSNFAKYFVKNLVVLLLIFAMLLLSFVLSVRQIITFGRLHKNILDKSSPYCYIVNPYYYVKKKIIKQRALNAKPPLSLQLSMLQQSSNKLKVAVVIIGETARRANFSLYGYARQTNPNLSKHKDIVVFNNTTSCGVNTAVSVPCIFYPAGSEQFKNNPQNYKSYLVYMAQLKDLSISWYDNNFGGCYKACKGDGIKATDTQTYKDAKLCGGGECLDEVLLQDIEPDIQSAVKQGKNALIVLHQNGSHGPLYYKRYPQHFAKFAPACQSSNPQTCTKQELINAYDNTILYTDFILSSIIDKLKHAKQNAKKQGKELEVLMIYTSDHGESLGENNLYLHGMPYSIAPREQKEIPLILWGSGANIVALNPNGEHSHDAITNSILDFFGIKSPLYNKDASLVAG